MADSLKESELTKKLVSDDPKERLDCIEAIQKQLANSIIPEDHYRKIWKALFYSLWVADKVKIQMELASRIAKLVHTAAQLPDHKLDTWLKTCFEIFHREWPKLDYWRTNKFLSLVRFCLNEIYALIEKKKFNSKFIDHWNEILSKNVLSGDLPERAQGLTLHLIQIFVEVLMELNRPSFKTLQHLLDPFLDFLATEKDKTLKRHVVDYVFKGFLSGLKSGRFKGFDIHKYIDHLLQKASAKEGVLEVNRKYLYEVVKEFQNEKDMIVTEDSANVEEEVAEEDHEEQSPSPNKQNKKRKGGDLEAEEEEPEASDDKKKKKKKKKKNKNKAKLEEKLANKENENEQQVQAQKPAQNEMKPEKTKPSQNETKQEKTKHAQNEMKQEKAKPANNQTKKKGAKVPEPEPIDEEEEEEEEAEEWEELPEEWDDDELDEDLLAPFLRGEDDEEFEQMTEEEYEELLKKAQGLPPYFLQTPAQQRKYFEKLNGEYYESLKKAKKNPVGHNKKVKMNLNKIRVQEFDKTEKVIALQQKKDPSTSTPAHPKKSILKKKVNPIEQKEQNTLKKPAKKKVKL